MENGSQESNVPAGDTPAEPSPAFQKKALLFKTLAILWIVPSLTSIFVILYQFPQASGPLETFKQIRLEQWLSFLLLLAHPAFVFLAWHYRKTELPTEPLVETPGNSGSQEG